MRTPFPLPLEYTGWCTGLPLRLELLNKAVKFEMLLRRFFVKDLPWWMFTNHTKTHAAVVMPYTWFNGANWANSKGCRSRYEKNSYPLPMCQQSAFKLAYLGYVKRKKTKALPISHTHIDRHHYD